MSRPTRDQVFISYSHLDREWLNRLQTMLRPLVRQGTISVWADTEIEPGDKWKREIEEALDSAKAAVLLVSDNFLASDFIAHSELPPLLNAAEKEGVKILWVAVSHCLYEETEIKDYHAVNNPNRPLDSLPPDEQKQVLADICRKIKKAATEKTPAELAEEEAQQRESERRLLEQARREELAHLEAEISAATVKEDWEAAIEHSEALLTLDPSNQKAQDTLEHAINRQELLSIYLKGEEHYKQGEVYLALKEFLALREKDKTYKDVEARIGALEESVEKNSERQRAAVRTAINNRDWEKADLSLKTLLRFSSPEEELKLELKEAKERQRAEETREEVERLSSEAGAAIEREDWEQAVENLKAIRQLDEANESALERLKFAERQLKLQTLYTSGQLYYGGGELRAALSEFREIHAEDSGYRDVAVLVPKLEKKLAAIERKRDTWEKLFPLRYYGSLALAAIGTLACLIVFILWLRGSIPQQVGTTLLIVVLVSWLSWLYFAMLDSDTSRERFGCLPILMLILLPLVALPSIWLAPRYRKDFAETYISDSATLIYIKKDYERAISSLTKAININPNNPGAYQYRGWAYMEKGDHERALADLSHAIELDRKEDAYLLTRGLAYYRKQDYANALANFDQAVWIDSNSALNYFWRGIFYFKKGDLDNAIRDFTSARKGSPAFGFPEAADYPNLSHYYNNSDDHPAKQAADYLNLSLYKRDNKEETLLKLQKSIKPESGLASDFAPAYLQRGKIYAGQEKYDLAILDFTYIINAKLNLDEAYFERGKAYVHKRDYQMAADDLTIAVNTPPQKEKEFYYLGWAFYGRSLYDEAISYADKAISLKQDYGAAYDLRGLARSGKNEYELAIQDYTRAIELSKDNSPSLYLKRGAAYEKSGNKSAAIEDFRKVLEAKDANLEKRAKEALQRLGVQN